MGRRKMAPQRRAEIVDALFDCLAEEGHEKVTVKAIAAKAGLPHGVIHYYFPSKDAVVSALTESLAARYEAAFLERLEEAEGAAAKLEAAVEFLTDEFIFNHRLNRVFYNLVQMGFERPEISTALKRLMAAYRANLARLLASSGGGEGARHVAAAMVALVEGLALQWMIEPGVFDRAEVRRLIGRAAREYLVGE